MAQRHGELGAGRAAARDRDMRVVAQPLDQALVGLEWERVLVGARRGVLGA